MYRRILVPLDGSERAEAVLPAAKSEASHHQATLVLMRVVPPLRHGLMLIPSILDDIREQAMEMARDYLHAMAETLRAEGLEVETEVQFGAPAALIVEFAERSGCDLIIVGSHGQSGASQWRFGSVANKIVKVRTSMPVLVINT